MPIYEYRCNSCKKEFQLLILKRGELQELVCPLCNAKEVTRLISRVVFHTSELDRLREYNPSRPQDESFYKDTRNIGLHAKKRAMEMGVDLGSGFEEKLERLRTNPKSVLDES